MGHTDRVKRLGATMSFTCSKRFYRELVPLLIATTLLAPFAEASERRHAATIDISGLGSWVDSTLPEKGEGESHTVSGVLYMPRKSKPSAPTAKPVARVAVEPPSPPSELKAEEVSKIAGPAEAELRKELGAGFSPELFRTAVEQHMKTISPVVMPALRTEIAREEAEKAAKPAPRSAMPVSAPRGMVRAVYQAARMEPPSSVTAAYHPPAVKGHGSHRGITGESGGRGALKTISYYRDRKPLTVLPGRVAPIRSESGKIEAYAHAGKAGPGARIVPVGTFSAYRGQKISAQNHSIVEMEKDGKKGYFFLPKSREGIMSLYKKLAQDREKNKDVLARIGDVKPGIADKLDTAERNQLMSGIFSAEKEGRDAIADVDRAIETLKGDERDMKIALRGNTDTPAHSAAVRRLADRGYSVSDRERLGGELRGVSRKIRILDGKAEELDRAMDESWKIKPGEKFDITKAKKTLKKVEKLTEGVDGELEDVERDLKEREKKAKAAKKKEVSPEEGKERAAT